MPTKGVTARAEQTAALAGLVHERKTAPQIGEWLASLDPPQGDPVADTNVRETRRTYERAVKVPTELVQETARVSTLAKDQHLRGTPR
jgi:carboxypeptidase Taq